MLQHWVNLISVLQINDKFDEINTLIELASESNLSQHELDYLSNTLNAPPLEKQHELLAMYQRGNHLSTEIAARLMIQHYPQHPTGWQILGNLLQDSGHPEQALEIKLKTVELFPKDANAHNNLAYTLLALGDNTNALESARNALSIDPKHPQAKALERQALAALAK